MRIVIDLQGAQSESRFRGIGRYTLSLANAIARNRGTHEVLIALNGLFEDTIKPVRDFFEGILPPHNIRTWYVAGPVRECNPANSWRRESAELAREAFLDSLQPDVIFLSSLFEGFLDDAVTSIGLLDQKPPTFVTLYDLIPLKNPETYFHPNPIYEQHYRRKIQSLKRAHAWMGISNFTIEEALETLGSSITKDKLLVNVGAACSEHFKKLQIPPETERKLRQQLGVSKPFVMYTGSSDSRKNLRRLIKAYAMLSPRIRNQFQLLLVGKFPENQVRSFQSVAKKAGLTQEEIVFTGYVSDETLVALYNLCYLFVFPSWHEGFGLPPLEAMKCGAPAIASNTSSLPEVMGWEEAMFDPISIANISRKISRALTDDRFRKDLIKLGSEQSRKFSWDICAQSAIEAFEQINLKSSRFMPWPSYLEHSERKYRRLINSIANVVSNAKFEPPDSDLKAVAATIAENTLNAQRFIRRGKLPDILKWRIEGPFDSSYSLALLNRETARCLAAFGHKAVLHSTEGYGDFTPNQGFFESHPEFEPMYKESASLSTKDADVTSRLLYPPRVSDMKCRINLLHHYAWEESGFPLEWARDFNEHLQGITCLSIHVEKIMIDHGIDVPLAVSGCGVDHWERIRPDASYSISAKRFRFLHVSSCFPRKGPDCLLKAYGKVFSRQDDVTLVIKTFPNPHNEIHRWYKEIKKADSEFPDVLIIEEELDENQLKSLYLQCSAMVAPSRAEGFGLPLAEAMLSGLPVIATRWGGHLDYCCDKNAWLVDYRFSTAKSHFDLFDSVWAEPDVDHLAKTMREIYEAPSNTGKEKALKGRSLLAEKYSWEKVTERLVASARRFSANLDGPYLNIGWITTWNTRCGIAFYSAHLIENASDKMTIFAARSDQRIKVDSDRVFRCWDVGEEDKLLQLEEAIEQQGVNALVVQFNYGFFNFDNLSRFLMKQIGRGITVVVTMHATKDPAHAPHKKLEELKTVLSKCHRILVHSINDLNRLKNLGLVANVTLFPHGIPDFTSSIHKKTDTFRKTFHIASYGFFLPHKGLLELLEAVKIIREKGLDVQLKMINAEYPIAESAELIKKAQKRIKSMGLNRHVEIISEFLPDEKCLCLLSEADLIVFPYQPTNESSSAAVRYGLASGARVAVTPMDIFEDVAPAVFYLPGNTPAMIAEGVSRLLKDIASSCDYIAAKDEVAERWRSVHRYSVLGRRFNDMLSALRRKQCGIEPLATRYPVNEISLKSV